ncbi:MAG: hypothetical protein IJR66_02985 [Clostridia bacterium]|nr:hypothetical protein [Clostridia bacterium]
MDEVISSIIEAEKKADEMVKNSLDNAKKANISAEKEAEEIKDKAIASFKLHRKTVLADAEKTANEKYEARLSEGEKTAKNISNKAEEKIKELAIELVNEITGK